MNSSETFVPNKELDVQLFAKQLLQNQIFIGHFQEKRYVASLQAYRDVVVVSNNESDLIRNLKEVLKRIHDSYPSDCWVGITDPNTVGAPAGYCFWVELPEDVLGSYWYKIRSIKFKEHEVLLRLKIVRPLETNISSSSPVNNSFTTEQLLVAATENISWFFANVTTLQNTKQTLVFLSVLLAAVVTGTINILQYLGDFTLKFMRETSHFVQVLTPSIIAFINLCGKIVGGFYLLILSMWRTRSPVYITNAPTNYSQTYRYPALQAPPRKSSVIITPLN